MSKQRHEIRIATRKLEVRRSASGRPVLVGMGVVYAPSKSSNLGGFVEQVKAGAFRDSLQSDEPIFLYYGHDQNQILGKTGANLTLRDSAQGLMYECELPDTTVAADVVGMIEAGVLTDASFGFVVSEDSWSQLPDGTPLRTIISAHLFEVSIVGLGAYPEAYADLRSMPASLRATLSTRSADDTDDDDIDCDDPENEDNEDCQDRACRCACNRGESRCGDISDERSKPSKRSSRKDRAREARARELELLRLRVG